MHALEPPTPPDRQPYGCSPSGADTCVPGAAALVKTQVESQIKVRDLSRAQVSIQPAEFSTWSDARAELMTEAKRPLKAQLDQELSAAASEAEINQIRAAFQSREKAIEHEIDHKQLEMHMSLGMSCECSSFRTAAPTPMHKHSLTHAQPCVRRQFPKQINEDDRRDATALRSVFTGTPQEEAAVSTMWHPLSHTV